MGLFTYLLAAAAAAAVRAAAALGEAQRVGALAEGLASHLAYTAHHIAATLQSLAQD